MALGNLVHKALVDHEGSSSRLTHALLHSTEFDDAVLSQTAWHKAQMDARQRW